MGCCFTTICRDSSTVEEENFSSGYSNIQLVHQGKNRSVHKCQHMDRQICFKIIPVKSLTWRNEINILEYSKNKNLPSPNLVKVFKKDEFMYVLYDFIQGEDLCAYINKHQSLSENTIKILVYNLLELVHKHHKYHIWHLDLKPENIICCDENTLELKLIDFGQSLISTSSFSKTQSLGTVGYSAPELFRGFCSANSDVWSIGIIVFVLFFKGFPFPIIKKIMVTKNLETYKAEVWPEKFKEFSSESLDFINKCLIIDMNERSTIKNLLKHPWFNK